MLESTPGGGITHKGSFTAPPLCGLRAPGGGGAVCVHRSWMLQAPPLTQTAGETVHFVSGEAGVRDPGEAAGAGGEGRGGRFIHPQSRGGGRRLRLRAGLMSRTRWLPGIPQALRLLRRLLLLPLLSLAAAAAARAQSQLRDPAPPLQLGLLPRLSVPPNSAQCFRASDSASVGSRGFPCRLRSPAGGEQADLPSRAWVRGCCALQGVSLRCPRRD